MLDFDLYSPGLHYLCCVILQSSPLERKNWWRGERVKELVELMKLQKKRRWDWASAEHETELDVLICLHNRGRTCYNTATTTWCYSPFTFCCEDSWACRALSRALHLLSLVSFSSAVSSARRALSCILLLIKEESTRARYAEQRQCNPGLYRSKSSTMTKQPRTIEIKVKHNDQV